LAPLVEQIISEQDEQGRWIVKDDKFRDETPGRSWNGEYRVADRISSRLFNYNVGVLCAFLEVVEMDGE
jgi:hypothetical protein